MTPLYPFSKNHGPRWVFGEWDIWLGWLQEKRRFFLATQFTGWQEMPALPHSVPATLGQAFNLSELQSPL